MYAEIACCTPYAVPRLGGLSLSVSLNEHAGLTSYMMKCKNACILYKGMIRSSTLFRTVFDVLYVF